MQDISIQNGASIVGHMPTPSLVLKIFHELFEVNVCVCVCMHTHFHVCVFENQT